MKKYLVFVLLLIASADSFADWVYGATLTQVDVSASGSVSVGLAAQPPGTCSFYGWYLTFDIADVAGTGATIEGTKSMLSILLAAKNTGKKVNISYTVSEAPGTNQNSGCILHMARINNITLP